MVLDDASNHRCSDLALPGNISLLFLPPYSPELNPKENLWDEIREKNFKNYALKSFEAVRAKLKQAILYIERNPETVKYITSFSSILKSLDKIWRENFCPHAIILTERIVLSPIFVAAIIGVEKLLRIDPDLTQGPVSFVWQMLDRLPERVPRSEKLLVS